MYLYSNFPECRLHSCVEQKAVSLLVTLTVSGSFIIKFLTCRRRSCFMFMVSSRYFLSRRRKENVCLQWHAQLVANSILQHSEHLSKARFVTGICEAVIAEILKKNNFYKWSPYFSWLNWTGLNEWGCCVWNNERSKQFFGAKSACACEEAYHKWAKWVFDLNI